MRSPKAFGRGLREVVIALAPMSTPRVGSSAIITRGPQSRFGRRGPFCWLPPDSAGQAEVGAAPLLREHRARRLALPPPPHDPEGGEREQARQLAFSVTDRA
jgi:hypothetical protein